MIALFTTPGPRVFNAELGRPFAEDFAQGVLHRLRAAGGGPMDLADIHVIVSTRRMVRALRRAFAVANGGATLGPRMSSLGDVDMFVDDDLHEESSPIDYDAFDEVDDNPPSVSSLSRLLFLTDLTRALMRSAPELGSATTAPALAKDLAGLLDSAQASGCALDQLEGVVAADKHAAHWALCARFLDIVRVAWPARLAEIGRQDSWERRRCAVARLAKKWATSPTHRPVIVAGSTGALDTSAWFIEIISMLPQGAIVLPGLDVCLDTAAAEAAASTPEHPQAGILSLLRRLGVSRDAVPAWVDTAPAPRDRLKVLSEAMRPAPVTDAWRKELPVVAEAAASGMRTVALIEAPTQRDEAAAIAIALREAIETPKKTASLVTPDRIVARRVAAALARWGVRADDSSGRPLGLTPPGVFFRSVLDVVVGDLAPAKLLGLLKHPFTAVGYERGVSARQARMLERDVFRVRGKTVIGFPALKQRAAECARRAAAAGDEPSLIDGAEDRVDEQSFGRWIGSVELALGPLLTLAAQSEAPLSEWLQAHIAASIALARTAASATGELFVRPAGETLSAFLEKVTREADPVGPSLSLLDYAALINQLIADEAVREPYGRHARIKIFGPLEARMSSTDLTIVAGLNEGTWPKPPEPDAWLSRDMRAAAGLPPLEARIGLSAHDFFQVSMAPTVIFTRSLKVDGAPTTPSRWLVRLTNLLTGAAPVTLAAMRARGAQYLAWAKLLDMPASLCPAPRPDPKPPLAARPLKFSASKVEQFIRDPYAIYAQRVLRLHPLQALADAPNARDRGALLHKIVEIFVRRTIATPQEDFERIYDTTVEELFEGLQDSPALHAFWRARAMRIKAWFIATEKERRATAKPVALEAGGEIWFDTALGRALLRAKADRIDLQHHNGGGYIIYDYKTGALPTDSQVTHFAKQLPLEAAILRAHGLEDAPKGMVRRLSYLQLAGQGSERILKTDADILATEAMDGLIALISAYANIAVGYRSRLRPQFINFDGEYDHLARYGEWRDGAVP